MIVNPMSFGSGGASRLLYSDTIVPTANTALPLYVTLPRTCNKYIIELTAQQDVLDAIDGKTDSTYYAIKFIAFYPYIEHTFPTLGKTIKYRAFSLQLRPNPYFSYLTSMSDKTLTPTEISIDPGRIGVGIAGCHYDVRVWDVTDD